MSSWPVFIVYNVSSAGHLLGCLQWYNVIILSMYLTYTWTEWPLCAISLFSCLIASQVQLFPICWCRSQFLLLLIKTITLLSPAILWSLWFLLVWPLGMVSHSLVLCQDIKYIDCHEGPFFIPICKSYITATKKGCAEKNQNASHQEYLDLNLNASNCKQDYSHGSASAILLVKKCLGVCILEDSNNSINTSLAFISLLHILIHFRTTLHIVNGW